MNRAEQLESPENGMLERRFTPTESKRRSRQLGDYRQNIDPVGVFQGAAMGGVV